MRNLFILVPLSFFIWSCGDGGDSKVLVMASGKVDVQGSTVNLSPGTQHNEVDVPVSDHQVTVIGPSGTTNFPVTESGLYILNLKTDTLVGSHQRVGTEQSQEVITQESLRARLDSLNQLMNGTNVQAEKKNYNIPPNKIVRITNNVNAEVIGPYKKMPSTFEAGKDHEIYKFYTNKEMQEIVDKLRGMVSDTAE